MQYIVQDDYIFVQIAWPRSYGQFAHCSDQLRERAGQGRYDRGPRRQSRHQILIRKKHLRCTVLAMPQDLEQLIDEITLDAYDLYEQLSGFLQVFVDEVTILALGTVVDFPVEVTGFDFEGDERRGLVAKYRHDGGMRAPSHWSTCATSRNRWLGGSTPPTGPGSVSNRFQLSSRRTGVGH
jgi:hypothetical protein